MLFDVFRPPQPRARSAHTCTHSTTFSLISQFSKCTIIAFLCERTRLRTPSNHPRSSACTPTTASKFSKYQRPLLSSQHPCRAARLHLEAHPTHPTLCASSRLRTRSLSFDRARNQHTPRIHFTLHTHLLPCNPPTHPLCHASPFLSCKCRHCEAACGPVIRSVIGSVQSQRPAVRELQLHVIDTHEH